MSKKEKQQEQPETEETELTVEDSKTETPPDPGTEKMRGDRPGDDERL